jgi:REP element-mobilizing transposase RayT
MKTQFPFAYFLNFRTYGTWLHGDERGSTSHRNNQYHTPFITPNDKLQQNMRNHMTESAFQLTASQQHTVLHAIIDTCQYNHWILYAAHVRIEHVHLVLQSSTTKEETQKIIKTYATKYLKKQHHELVHREHIWSRHGSTKNIWASVDLFPALYYVVKKQGEPMALFYDEKFYAQFDEQLYELYSEQT